MKKDPPPSAPWRAVSRRLRVHRSWRFLRLRGAGGSLPCSPAVAAAAPTPPGDRRGGFDSPAGSCRRTFGAEHKLVPARRGQQLLVDQRKRSSPRRWLASGARTRCSIERGSLEVKFAVRHPRGDVSAPFLDVILLKSTCPVARPLRTQVSAPWRQFRPRVALEPPTGQLRLIVTVNLCRAGSPQPSYSRPDPCHSIDFTPPRFRFLLSLVARRRSARAYRRPRARPRRGEGVQDMQLDGTVASRRIWRSSRSPVPVPVAHCAPRMQCRSTPPTLVPRPHRG